MVVEKGIERALAIHLEQLRSEKLKNNSILSFISTCNPNNPNVFPKVREMYGNIQTSETLGKIFAKYKLIDYKRKFKNWRQPFILKSNFNRETPNLIYVITCSSCNKE